MEIVKIILDIAFDIMLIMACIFMIYVLSSVLIQTIRKDILDAKTTSRLIRENVELREEIDRLQLQLIDKNLAE